MTKVGYKHTEEAKQKMSATKKGCVFSEEHLRNLCIARRNRPPMTIESKRKLSDSKWKGGKSKTNKGHIRLYIGNGVRVMEQRQIWETTHSKKLPDGYITHHINGDRGDNRPWNLLAMTNAEHTRLHLLRYHHFVKPAKELNARS